MNMILFIIAIILWILCGISSWYFLLKSESDKEIDIYLQDIVILIIFMIFGIISFIFMLMYMPNNKPIFTIKK